MQIVMLESGSVRATFRRPAFEHRWTSYESTRQEDLRERLAQAAIAVVNKLKIDAALIAGLPDLRMIAVAATGADNIDLAACRARGIVVSNVRGYARNSVPEHALMLMLALRRRLLDYRADVTTGKWCRSPNFCLFGSPVGDLHGRTLAVVGAGSLGRGVAALAQAFGMKAIFAERRGVSGVRAERVPFEEALSLADVVSLHCPLTVETSRLIGAKEIGLMKPSAILINTARGGLIDEAALAEALRVGRIAGAGLDVLSSEPPAADHPLLAPDLPNLIVTPHVAWASDEAMQDLAGQVIDNIESFVAGSPRNRLA